MANDVRPMIAQLLQTASEETTLVCFCHQLSAAKIQALIDQGHHSVNELRAQTCSTSGCGGCTHDIHQMVQRCQLRTSDRNAA